MANTTVIVTRVEHQLYCYITWGHGFGRVSVQSFEHRRIFSYVSLPETVCIEAILEDVGPPLRY